MSQIQESLGMNGEELTPAVSVQRKRKATAMLVTPEDKESKNISSSTPASVAVSTPGTGKSHSKRFVKLEISSYVPKIFGSRILSCGEGEQLGHPGRNVTRKPRAIDTFPEGVKFVQVVAGGVHSVVLTDDGKIYSCGINEKGTVPVEGLEAEESTDRFTEIIFDNSLKKLGQPVQITSGASFSAALTKKGSVVAWGNLRDTQGEVTVHKTLTAIQKAPVIVITHKSKIIVKIAAGENHLAMLSNEGEILTFGDGSMGQLGRSSRTEHIRSSYMVDSSGKSLKLTVLERGRIVKFTDVFANGYWTMGKAEDGRIFTCGLNNYRQLGVQQNHKESVEASETGEEEISKITHLTLSEAFDPEKNWTHIAGVHHVVARSDDGELYAMGRNLDNALGLGTWKDNTDVTHWRYDSLQRVNIPGDLKVAGVDASLGTSIAWTTAGKVFAFGYDTVGQLGLNVTEDEDKMIPTPTEVHSAHLTDYEVVGVSLADNHALFLAARIVKEVETSNGEVVKTTKDTAKATENIEKTNEELGKAQESDAPMLAD